MRLNGVDWLLRADGTQYKWINADLGWGLGYLTITNGHESVKRSWNKPVGMSADSVSATYMAGGIRVSVERRLHDGESDLWERYTFTNTSSEALSLTDIGIYTPFNDNYPNAKTCINNRTNVHVWAGGNAAYVNALRMGGQPPHIGLVVIEGAINDYEIWERGSRKGHSQNRGVFALNPPDQRLRPNESYSVAWRVSAHLGNDDFRSQILRCGGVLVESDRYVFQCGDTAHVTLASGHELSSCGASLNGVPIPIGRTGDKYNVSVPMRQAGIAHIDFRYDGDKHTYAECMVFNNFDSLLSKRIDFIRRHQQMNDETDPRYGAYMVYDNEGDSIYLNDTPNCNPVDRDEGAERIGMGVLLAKQYLLTRDESLKTSLLRYAKFLREQLQTVDFKTYSSVDKRGRNRAYNYIWTADFFFLMYHVTEEKNFAIYGYETLQSFYRQFGHGFYAIDVPVCRGIQTLKAAGMDAECGKLLSDFRQTGDTFIANGLNYPKHEVNYEQSIVAPAVHFLLELYQETKEEKYLAEAKHQMPVLEAFNGFQPSFHLNDIAIRHWDGYWFGKREMFGDTFPHYWSTITAGAFHLYAQATGDESYQRRAENIVRNNLCLFSEDGRASCAYLYPRRVDGVKAQFYDPYANDQDWALVYYLLVFKGI